MIRRYLLYVGALAAILALSVAMRSPHKGSHAPRVDHSKYIKFSHAYHVKEQSIACTDCHHAIPTSALATDNALADHESCKGCHQEKIDSTCSFCHVDPDNIVAIPKPALDLVFSHQLHVTTNKLACETCHPGVDSVQYATNANMPGMATCTSCHESRGVTAECVTCHRDYAGLIPPDHLEGDFRRDHRHLTRIGAFELTCSTCHTESFCQDCHTGVELHGFGATKDLMADPAPRMGRRDTPRDLKLQGVHDLNYRFTHGNDAASKRLDCASCHEEQTFCAQCHQAGGNINQQGFVPATHREAGFVTIGKGSGGGRHAELARQDLESCTACHDVRGADPVCMRCHTEGGDVR